MNGVVKTARLTLVGAALLLMVSGMLVWEGRGGDLGAFHVLLGLVLALSLWIIAGVAARLGISPGLVAAAVAWSLAAMALGLAQEVLIPGSRHWTIQALHLVTAMGMVAWGQGLFLLIRRAGAGPERTPGRASAARVK